MYVFEDRLIDTNININVETKSIESIIEFRPLEITTLIDIFISNSEKAKATQLNFLFKKDKRQD